MSDDDLRQEAEALHHGAWQCNTNREAEELIFAALRRERDSERQRCAAVCRGEAMRCSAMAGQQTARSLRMQRFFGGDAAAGRCADLIERGEG